MTDPARQKLAAVSLFSGAGIGDLGVRAAGIDVVASCEVEKERADLLALNFPRSKVFVQDIWQCCDEITESVQQELASHISPLFLVVCTAPCQGMSKNGQGSLLNLIRQGKRPSLDPRNRLILPALNVIRRLNPEWIIFENVQEMRSTVIEDENGRIRPILEVVRDSLGTHYVGEAYDVEFADYGIPQRRQRLITIYTRNRTACGRYLQGHSLVPPRTHARQPGRGLLPWVSVSSALSHFPELDSKDASANESHLPFHRVSVLDPKKYEWIIHTPKSSSAFDNQCINPNCLFDGNRRHGASHNKDGINRSHSTTPLYCEQCGQLLPRPYSLDPDGSKRIMSGYTSAYKRMDPDLPAPALTRNLSFPCSDQKIHPYQNRVLSLAEAMTLQTVSDYPYVWGPVPKPKTSSSNHGIASDSLIRLVIGESVPPRFLELLCNHIQQLSSESTSDSSIAGVKRALQHALF